MAEVEGLRYRAVLSALLSLRGRVEGERAPAERGIRYRERAGRGIAPRLDVWEPAQRASKRSVLLVHGGGFLFGSRDMKPMRVLGSRLSEAGLTVGSIDYRLVFRGGRIEEALADTREALRYWRDRCARRGLDPEAVTLVGLSAGATLAMIVAGEEGAGVRRLVSAFGLYELEHLEGALASVLPRLVFRSTDRVEWARRSPRQASQPRCPTLLLHGSADGLVPVAQARRLAAHRQALGLPTTLSIYDGAPHGFFNQPGEHATRGVREILAHALD
ncbi:MAG: alpha/beta hydrolase [Sandaracinaceae bacterium]|nr:alpha/beta hydrolase [Sandaracinaceae bacterium]